MAAGVHRENQAQITGSSFAPSPLRRHALFLAATGVGISLLGYDFGTLYVFLVFLSAAGHAGDLALENQKLHFAS
jgi:hypothetical protein